jgi:hypothetical protein
MYTFPKKKKKRKISYEVFKFLFDLDLVIAFLIKNK